MYVNEKEFLPLTELINLLKNIALSHSPDVIQQWIQCGILGGGNTGLSIKIRDCSTQKVLVAQDIMRQRPQSSNRAAGRFLNGGFADLDLSGKPNVSRPRKTILDDCKGSNPKYEISVRSTVAVLNKILGTTEFDAALPANSNVEIEGRNKGGRPQKYDWYRWSFEAFYHFKHSFIPVYQRVPSDDDVLDWSEEWFKINTDKTGDVPRRVEIKKRISQLIKSLEDSFNEAPAIK